VTRSDSGRSNARNSVLFFINFPSSIVVADSFLNPNPVPMGSETKGIPGTPVRTIKFFPKIIAHSGHTKLFLEMAKGNF
jgi:hypothetical protein